MSDQIKIKRVLCKECKIETNHQILFAHETSGHDEENGVSYYKSYQMAKCAGCESVTFIRISSNTDDVDYEKGTLEEYIELFPERDSKRLSRPTRSAIDCEDLFPPKTRRVYREVIKGLAENLPVLTAIGIRAIIESVCIDLYASGSNLQKKIDDLASKGHLATSQAQFLHGLRFMGNSAAHEIEAAKPAEIVAALEIAETLLKTLYLLPDLAKTIQTGRPAAPSPPVTPTPIVTPATPP